MKIVAMVMIAILLGSFVNVIPIDYKAYAQEDGYYIISTPTPIVSVNNTIVIIIRDNDLNMNNFIQDVHVLEFDIIAGKAVTYIAGLAKLSIEVTGKFVSSLPIISLEEIGEEGNSAVNTGIFRMELLADDIYTSDIYFEDGDRINIEYEDLTEVPSITRSVDIIITIPDITVEIDRDIYRLPSPTSETVIHVTIIDTLFNKNPNSIDSILLNNFNADGSRDAGSLILEFYYDYFGRVTFKPNYEVLETFHFYSDINIVGGNFPTVASETGIDTGVFTVDIVLPTSINVDGMELINDTTYIRLLYLGSNNFDESGASAILFDTSTITATITTDKYVYNLGDTVVLTVNEPDWDQNRNKIDEIPLDISDLRITTDKHINKTLRQLVDENVIELNANSLIETRKNSGIFTIVLRNINESFVSAGGWIKFVYYDSTPTLGGNEEVEHAIYIANINNVILITDDFPTVDEFDVNPKYLALDDNQSFEISYSVSDDNGLKRVELWIADDDNGKPVNWREVKELRQELYGETLYSGIFKYKPASAGVYWYGIHAVDNYVDDIYKDGHCNDESNNMCRANPPEDNKAIKAILADDDNVIYVMLDRDSYPPSHRSSSHPNNGAADTDFGFNVIIHVNIIDNNLNTNPAALDAIFLDNNNFELFLNGPDNSDFRIFPGDNFVDLNNNNAADNGEHILDANEYRFIPVPTTAIETGPNTRVFEFDITLPAFIGTDDNTNNDTPIDDNFGIEVTYTSSGGNDVTATARIEPTTASISTDSNTYSIGNDIKLIINEPDWNVDSEEIDVLDADLSAIFVDARKDGTLLDVVTASDGSIDLEPYVITETGPNTGIFMITIENINEEFVERGSNIRFEYEDSTITNGKQIIEHAVNIIKGTPEIIFDKDVYTPFDEVCVTIVDKSANTDPDAKDELFKVEVEVGEFIDVFRHDDTNGFEETAPDSGIFMLEEDECIQLDADLWDNGNSDPNDGVLPAARDEEIIVTYKTATGNIVISKSTLLVFNEGSISFDKPSYNIGDEVIIRVIDPDLNWVPDLRETISINVWSTTDEYGLLVKLLETTYDSGMFVGKIILSSNISTGNRLQVSNGDIITARYIDRTLPYPASYDDEIDATITLAIKELEVIAIINGNNNVYTNFTLNVYEGWNMISIPLEPINDIEFDGYLYTWNATDNNYILADKIEPYKGYWLLSFTNDTINIIGKPITSIDIELDEGWHMIGSVYNNATLSFDNNNGYNIAYTWDAINNNYIITDKIEAGKGYWILLFDRDRVRINNQ